MSIETLQKFSQRLRDLPRVVAQKVAEAAAEKITELGRQTFDAGEDAYGVQWAPAVDGEKVDLVEDGDLKKHVRYKAIGTKLRSELGVAHAKFQVGKRPVYPRGTLPAAYQKALEETTQNTIRTALGGS